MDAVLPVMKKGLLAILVWVWFVPSAGYAADPFVKYSEAQKHLSSNIKEEGSITPEALSSLLKEGNAIVIFDARTANEYRQQHIAGAVLPLDEDYYRRQALFQQKVIPQPPSQAQALARNQKKLPKDTRIVTYCNRKCALSKQLKKQLEGLGFTNVQWLAGGINDWQDKGYPTESTPPTG